MEHSFDISKLSKSFLDIISNPEISAEILCSAPIPIEIFDAGGTSVFINRALMDLNGIQDANLVTGHYNVLNDPVCNDQLGYREDIQRAFQGETVCINNFPAPIQDLVDRGVTEEKPYESALMDLHMYPLWNGDELAYVVCVFIVKSIN